MSIKAITFDFWSTLYKGKTINYTKRLHRLQTNVENGSGVKFTPEQFATAVKVARKQWSQAWQEEHRTLVAQEWLEIMLQNLETTLPAESFQAIQTDMEDSVLKDRPTPAPKMEVVLAELASQYKLAIISDTGLTPGRILRQILTEDKLAPYFTHFTFSDELGRSKPHPTAFLSTLKALEATPAQAVHLGDLLRTDIAGAQGVGMRGVQYIGLNYDKGDGSITPDAVINDHPELGELLQRWNEAVEP